MRSTNCALVIGVTGQDGSLMAKSLLDRADRVVGTSRSVQPILKNLNKLNVAGKIEILQLEASDTSSIQKVIREINPSEIYHLSGQSSVGKSFQDPISTYKSIVLETLSILEGCRKLNFNGRIFFAGSGDMFGATDGPANIKSPKNPVSPYGISKKHSYDLVRYYRNVNSLKCVTGVLFNHESPLRPEHFVTQKIIQGALRASQSKDYILKMGNISISRDWGWAEEYVQAMQVINLAENCQDHVICSGKSNTIKIFIEKVFSSLGLDWKNHIKIDKQLFRSSDIAISHGDPLPLKEELSWSPKVDLDSIVQRLLQEKM